MLFDDTYRTIENPSEGSFRDRGSKFIAYAFPVADEAAGKTAREQLKTEHPKANHHCWALRMSPDRSVFRVNDDGEPSGTAGRPILNTLLSRDLTNLVVVVVRYFGGTLLGVPGLVNAYKSAAEDALNNAVVIERTVDDFYSLHFDYLQMNEVMKVVKEYETTVVTQDFGNECKLILSVRKTQVNPILDKLQKISGVTVKYHHTA